MSVPDPRPVAVVKALAGRGQTLATAESLTGGLIGATVTTVPGSSAVYLGGLITYATDLKASLGGVPGDVLEAHGPVSPETAAAMAAGVRQLTGADWALAATGVAGPDPQDGRAPGEVWLGLAGPDGESHVRRYDFTGDRTAIREHTVRAALDMLAAALGAGEPPVVVEGTQDTNAAL